MPMYEYECQSCGVHFERWQRMTDESLTSCEQCSGSVRRVIFPVGIIFKGSGFYVTDNRKNGANGKSDHKDGDKAETKSETKTESKAGARSGGDAKANGTSPSEGSKSGEKAGAASGT